MKVFTGHHELSTNWHGGVYAIGNFDGLHIAHRALIQKAFQVATEMSSRPAVLTFDPHPRELFDAAAIQFRLSTSSQKMQDLAKLGADFCVNQRFDFDFARLTPVEFVEFVLSGSLSASHVVVGTDFRFGSRQAGNAEILQELCVKQGISISVIDQITFANEAVSSSLIRDHLEKGEMSSAEKLLGRPWTVLVSPDFADGETSFDFSNYTKIREGEYSVRIGGIACCATLVRIDERKQLLLPDKEWSQASFNNVIVEFVS